VRALSLLYFIDIKVVVVEGRQGVIVVPPPFIIVITWDCVRECLRWEKVSTWVPPSHINSEGGAGRRI